MTSNPRDLARLLALTMASALMVIGCASTGPRAGQDEAGGGASDLLISAEATDALNYRVAWQADLAMPTDESVRSVTRLGGDRLAVIESAEAGNLLTLLDDTTGRLLWRVQLGEGRESLFRPILDSENRRIFVHSESMLYILAEGNGNLRERFELPHSTNQPGLLLNSRMLYGTLLGRLYAQSLRTGNHVWSYQMGASVSAPLRDVRGLVMVVDRSGGVAVLNFEGGLVWRRFEPPWNGIDGAPAVVGDLAILASRDQKLYAFERATGDLEWEMITEQPLTARPVAIDQRIYQQVPQRGLLAVDATTGELLWENANLTGEVLARRGEALLVRAGGRIVLARQADGKIRQAVDLPLAEQVVAPDTDNPPLYLIGAEGRVLKMTPRG